MVEGFGEYGGRSMIVFVIGGDGVGGILGEKIIIIVVG